MIYLIEPYNAHQKPPRKKHWTEIAEEEALHHKIAMETDARNSVLRQMAIEEAIHQNLVLREANAKQNQNPTSVNNQNVALPQYTPQPAQQQTQDGQYAAPAGGGGYPPLSYFLTQNENAEVAAFALSPASGIGPLTVNFVNQSQTPLNDTFYWDFGSGSLTSTSISPSSVTYTQTGSYTVTLQETSSTGFSSSATNGVTVIAPTVTPALVADFTTGAAPLPVTFSNNTTYHGSGTLTYLWDFGSGSLTSTLKTPSMSYANPGTFTVSLQVTESSYGIAAKGTRANYIVAS